MPHYIQPMQATPMGAACPMCGVLPPMWTCGNCGTFQLLAIPGAPMPTQNAAGMGQPLAPVVQAPQGSSTSTLLKLFEPMMKGFGESAGQAIFG